LAYKKMSVGVEMVIFIAERGNRRKRIGAALVKGDEEAGAGDARDLGREDLADLVGEEHRGKTIRRFALRDHGTPFGRRNLDADLLELRRFLRFQPVLAEPEGGNQAAMDKEVRIAPDGRGEMRVIREMQAEVMQVFGAVDSLRLT